MTTLQFNSESFSLHDEVDVAALCREIQQAVTGGGGWVILRGAKITRTVLFTPGYLVWINSEVDVTAAPDATSDGALDVPRNLVPQSANKRN